MTKSELDRQLEELLAEPFPMAKPKPPKPKPDVKPVADSGSHYQPGKTVRYGYVRPVGEVLDRLDDRPKGRIGKAEVVGRGPGSVTVRHTFEEIMDENRARLGLPPLAQARAMRESLGSYIPVDFRGAGATSEYNPITAFVREQNDVE